MLSLEQAIRRRIISLAKERNITINKVSTLAGIPHTTLLMFMNEKTHDLRISTLLHICEAFHISLNDFFNANYFEDVNAE